MRRLAEWSHLPVPGEDMHLHNGVLDGTQPGLLWVSSIPLAHSACGARAWSGRLGMLVCSVLAWGRRRLCCRRIVGALPDQGMASFQRGDFEQAVVSWGEAARRAEKAQQPKAQSVALTHVAQAYQALGHYRQAMQKPGSGAGAGPAHCRPGAKSPRSWAALGISTLPLDQRTKPNSCCARRCAWHKSWGRGLAARILHNLGNLFMSQQKPQEALGIYRDVAVSATQAGSPAVAASALTHAAMAAVQSGHPQDSLTLLHNAWEQMQRVHPSHDKAYALVNMGLTYHDLRAFLVDSASTLVLSASAAFNEAANVAQAIDDPRAASYAWGYLVASTQWNTGTRRRCT